MTLVSRKLFGGKKEKVLKVLFATYLILVFLIIILKVALPGSSSIIDSIKWNREQGFWNYNLTPFKTIKGYLFECVSNELSLDNILGNTVPFMPMGGFLGILLNKNKKFIKVLVSSFLIIFFFEMVQFVSCLGFFDIDDIILNVGSSLLGYGICVVGIHLKNIGGGGRLPMDNKGGDYYEKK